MEPVFASPARRLMFGGLLMWVMVAATSSIAVIPVLASFLIDDFGITRTELGGLGAVGGLLGAMFSPYAGRITDRIGGRNSAATVLVGAALAAVLLAAAPVFAAMFVGVIVASVTGSGGNPSTNKLIAAAIAPGRRGLLTGLKQTGPQVGSLLAGLLAPWGATVIGWRATLLVMAGLLAAPVPFFLRIIPGDRPAPRVGGEALSRLPTEIWWVAVYGALLGFGGGAIFLLPLFVEEELGQTPRVAGLAAALVGAVAILGRLQWGRIVDRRATPARAMMMLALLAMVAVVFMQLSISSGIGWMWLGATVFAVSASSWTVVGALAVIDIGGVSSAGRASGIVWFGFLGGFGIGPPVFGFTVDQTGSYALMWWLALTAFALAALLIAVWTISRHRSRGSHSREMSSQPSGRSR